MILPYCYMKRFTSNYCIPDKDINKLLLLYRQLAINRINNLDFLEDIADIYGKIIDLEKLKAKVQIFAQNKDLKLEEIKDLTPDETFVLIQFLQLLSTANTNEFDQQVQSLLSPARSMQSLIWVLEVK